MVGGGGDGGAAIVQYYLALAIGHCFTESVSLLVWCAETSAHLSSEAFCAIVR